eukprot:m.499268 g.499268  ORF g.499268 m.499268 type:complete len:118 (+) comp21825_c0_seq13:1626-1979(+)
MSCSYSAKHMFNRTEQEQRSTPCWTRVNSKCTRTRLLQAIALSGTFPLLGVPGLMLSGYLVDHYDRKRNGEIVAVNCGVLLVLAMILWWIKQFMASPPLCAIVRGVTGNLWMQSIHT